MRYFNIIAFLLCSTFCLGQTFEGTVNFTMQNHAVGEDTKIVWTKKGDNHRLDVNTTVDTVQYAYTLLFQANNPIMYMLSDAGGEKWVYETPIEVLNGQDVSLSGAREVKDLPAFGQVTGNCKSWIVENAFLRGEFCLDDNAGLQLTDFPPLVRAANYFRFLEKRNISATPIEIHTFDLEGTALYSQTIEKIEVSKISLDKFQIPEGYKVRK